MVSIVVCCVETREAALLFSLMEGVVVAGQLLRFVSLTVSRGGLIRVLFVRLKSKNILRRKAATNNEVRLTTQRDQ